MLHGVIAVDDANRCTSSGAPRMLNGPEPLYRGTARALDLPELIVSRRDGDEGLGDGGSGDSSDPKSPLSPLRISAPGPTDSTMRQAPRLTILEPDEDRQDKGRRRESLTRERRLKRTKRLSVRPHLEDFEPDLELDELDSGADSRCDDGAATKVAARVARARADEARFADDPLARRASPDHSESTTQQHVRIPKELIKNVGDLTNLMLDTRKALRSDYHIVEDEGDDSHLRDGGAAEPASAVRISLATRARAEKVRSMLGLHYLFIQRCYERTMAYSRGDIVNTHPGVDGVYNPLQTIRNRALRAKYREFPKPMSIKTIPLASNVFSLHSLRLDTRHRRHLYHADKHWKMIWAVELQEEFGDFAWQHLHWHELVKLNGELWFPPADPSTITGKHVRRRLHDRLFNADDEKGSSNDSKHLAASWLQSTSAVEASDGDDNGRSGDASSVDEVRAYSIKRVHARKRRRSVRGSKSSEGDSAALSQSLALAKGSIFKRLYRHSISSDSEGLSEVELASNAAMPEGQVTEPDDKPSVEELEVLQDPNEALEEPGLLDTDSNSVEVVNVNDLAIKPLDRPHNDIDEDGETAANPEKGIASACLPIDEAISDIVPHTKLLRALFLVRSHYFVSVLPQLLHRHCREVNALAMVDIPRLVEVTIKVNDDLLPAYESIYSGLLEEISTLVHEINTDYSIRIDNLLSNSDRLIGEINTSILMELRKFSEHIDRLNSSMFGSRFTIERNDHKDQVLRMNDSSNKLLYCFIENAIIVLLRVIWIVVNVYKFFRACVLMVWRVVRLL